jgi:hypothetical protein
MSITHSPADTVDDPREFPFTKEDRRLWFARW